MNRDEVLRAVYVRGHEVGASEGASELAQCSPEYARRVLELLGSDREPVLYNEFPLLMGHDPDDWPSLNDTTSMSDDAMMVLEEAGLQRYDGIAAPASLVRSYDSGYDDGFRDGFEQAARRVLDPGP